MIVARHHVIEFDGCSPERADDPALVRRALARLCRDAGLNVVRRVQHRFTPHGLTVLYILRESHLAYSSWPEKEYAVLDLFLCGPMRNIGPAAAAFARALRARRARKRAWGVGPKSAAGAGRRG